MLSLLLVGLLGGLSYGQGTDHSRLILSFSQNCSQHRDYHLVNYIYKEYARVSSEKSAKFLQLVAEEPRFSATVKSLTSKFLQLESRSARRARQGIPALNYFSSYGVALENRTLGETSITEREDEIVAALHTLVGIELVGAERIEKYLHHEQYGDMEQMVEILAQAGFKKAEAERILEKQAKSLTVLDSLEFLPGLKIVNCEFVKDDLLLRLARLLPCLAGEPQLDKEQPPEPLDSQIIPLKRSRKRAGRPTELLDVDIIDWRILKKRLQAESHTGVPSLWTDRNQTIKMVKPFDGVEGDPLDYMWQFQTYDGKTVNSSSDVLSGLAYVIYKLVLKKNPQIIHEPAVVLNMKTLLEDTSIDWKTIGVIDSGCYRHPDLVNQFWHNYETPGCVDGAYAGNGPEPQKNDCVGYDFGMDQPDPTIPSPNGESIHGTACSGLAVAQANNGYNGIIGTCPMCKLMCLKVTSENNVQYTTSSLKALNYLHEHGVKINSYSASRLVREPIIFQPDYPIYEDLGRSGVLTFAAAGNQGENIDPGQYSEGPELTRVPAAYKLDSIITVGNNNRAGLKAPKSNYGSQTVDIFAPGTDLAVLYPSVDTPLALLSGTSLSTPIAAGIAGTVWSVYPQLTYKQVREAIENSVLPHPSLRPYCISGGVISLSRALAYAEQFIA